MDATVWFVAAHHNAAAGRAGTDSDTGTGGLRERGGDHIALDVDMRFEKLAGGSIRSDFKGAEGARAHVSRKEKKPRLGR